MIRTYDKSGKTEEEAVSAALADLGLDRDDVSVEILERAKSGFLGIGSSPAVVRLSYETPDEAPKPAEPRPAPAPRPAAPSRPAAPPRPAEQRRPERERPSAPPPPPREPRYADDALKGETESFVRGLLERMGIAADIEITDREQGGLLVNLSGDGMGAVIGRRGETLDAIQHLTNYVVNRGNDKRCHISVDAEAYRAKREESLEHLAEKMAAKVVKYKRSMALEPMNSYERHVIHTALQDYEGVSTSSTGVEPNRRVVVSYEKTALPNGVGKPQSREWS